MNFVQIIWITVAITAVITIFGLRYLKHRENMFLIRKDQFLNRDSNFSGYFSTGIIFISISVAIVVGIIATQHIDNRIVPHPLIYVLSVSFFCGIALLISYYYFKKLK